MEPTTEIVKTLFIAGTSLCIFFGLFIMCFTYISIEGRTRDKKAYLNTLQTLTTEIISLDKQLQVERHAYKDVIEKYLFFLVDLLNAVDKHELVMVSNLKNNIEANIFSVYESIQKELQMLSYNLYAENSQGLPFNSAVSGFVKLHNKVISNNKVKFDITDSDKAIDYTNLFSIAKMINIASQEDIDLLVINEEKVLFNKRISDNSLNRLKVMSLMFKYRVIETDNYVEVVF